MKMNRSDLELFVRDPRLFYARRVREERRAAWASLGWIHPPDPPQPELTREELMRAAFVCFAVAALIVLLWRF
ncbi:MAG: hypothetical protein ACRDQZ_09260 [Mycobacteriales bacterium]